MLASRQDWHRALDFSAVKNADVAMANAILALLRRRKNPMRLREIERWFRGTPQQFIGATLGDMVLVGKLDARRSSLGRNWVLEYSLPVVYCPTCGVLVEVGEILAHGHGLSISVPVE